MKRPFILSFAILFFVAIFFCTQCHAQIGNTNRNLPGFEPLPENPKIRQAVIDAAEDPSKFEDARDLFKSFMEDGEGGAEAYLMYAIFVADGTEKATEIQGQILEDCVYKFTEYSPCYVWLGLHKLHVGEEGSGYSKARIAFEAADRLGSSSGTWHLAMMYLKGQGMDVDESKAFTLVRKSARADYPPALHSYAVMKSLGQGTDINMCDAFNAAARGAYLGGAKSMGILAEMFGRGDCVDINLAFADLALWRAWQMGEPYSVEKMKRHWNSLSNENKRLFTKSILTHDAEFDKLISEAKRVN